MRIRIPARIAVILCCITIFQLHAAQPAQKRAVQHPVISSQTLAKLDAHTNLTYARYGERELQLDLFRPKDASKPLPVVICIHGGGWFEGDRASMRPLAQAMASRGFVTVTISYRLSGEKKFPAQIEDCKAAVRWLRANAAKFGVDANAVGVTGLSAGGHLTTLLATSGGVKEFEGEGGNASESSAGQACVAMGAQSDLETDRIRALSKAPENPHYRPFLGGTLDSIPQTYALASPRHHLDNNDPPMLFMTGELDDASTHADDMRHDMDKLGVSTGLKIIPSGPHAFLGQQKNFNLAVETCDEFFSRHLRKRVGH